MKYCVTLVLGMDPFVEHIAVGVYRWKLWAKIRGLLAAAFGIGLPGHNRSIKMSFGRMFTVVVWDIPTKMPGRMHNLTPPDDGDAPRAWFGIDCAWECKNCETIWKWDGYFAPKWLWSKKPCVWCSTEAKAQGFSAPVTKPKITVLGVPIDPDTEPDCPECANGMYHETCRSGWKDVLRENQKRTFIDPDAMGIVEAKSVRSTMTPELSQALVLELLEAQFSTDQVAKIIDTNGFNREEWLTLQKKGLVPKWKPPCAACGSNCGQCASSHCNICGSKGGFPTNLTCDPIMHAAFEATKCKTCGDYAYHFCLNNKEVGEEFSAKKTYKKGEKDVQGMVVNPGEKYGN